MRFRCHDAATTALVTNPHFAHLDWVREKASDYAARLLKKDTDAAACLFLPPADARAFLKPVIPHIIKAQKATGCWRARDARLLSYAMLRALAHAGLLDAVLPQLRFDPFTPFREAEDWLGSAVRCGVLHAPRADESALQAHILAELAALQQDDGSWEHTVIATVYHLEILTALNQTASDSFARGITYLFARLRDDVPTHNRLFPGQLVAHDMLTAADRRAEYRGALAHKPEWLPVGACYNHLPIIQTGYALRFLNTAGHADDPRVLAACENFVELFDRFGGWCDTYVRMGLQAEKKRTKECR